MEIKHKYADTTNEKLNVQMTTEQWDVVSFVAFESETALVYPFKIKFDDLTMEMIERIVNECDNTSDTEALYEVCEHVLGTN